MLTQRHHLWSFCQLASQFHVYFRPGMWLWNLTKVRFELYSSPLTAGGLHPLHALPGQRRLHRLDPGRARDPLQVSGCMVTMTVITIPAATAWSSATRATTASCCRPSRSSPPARRCGPSTWPWPGRSSRPSPRFNVRLVPSSLAALLLTILNKLIVDIYQRVRSVKSHSSFRVPVRRVPGGMVPDPDRDQNQQNNWKCRICPISNSAAIAASWKQNPF